LSNSSVKFSGQIIWNYNWLFYEGGITVYMFIMIEETCCKTHLVLQHWFSYRVIEHNLVSNSNYTADQQGSA
jgi:hypothetical protein